MADGVCVEVGGGVCVEVGGGVCVEVGEGMSVAVGFFISAVCVALGVRVGVDVGGKAAIFFAARAGPELASDRTTSTPVNAITKTLVSTTTSKTATILPFIN